MVINKKMIQRSVLVGLGLTVLGIGLQTINARFIIGAPPPILGRTIGITVWYLITMVAFAFAWFAFQDRWPGQTWLKRGLRYSNLVIVAVWIGGFIGMAAIDFNGGWNLLTPAKTKYLWIALWDFLTLTTGGLVLGLISRNDGPPPIVQPTFRSTRLARIMVSALMLPCLSASFFYLIALVIPTGYNLTGTSGQVFYTFLFAPLIVSGMGNALLHETLFLALKSISAKLRTIWAYLVIYLLFWVTNSVFVVFFDFTWQVLVIFLIALAASLFPTFLVIERFFSPVPKEATV